MGTIWNLNPSVTGSIKSYIRISLTKPGMAFPSEEGGRSILRNVVDFPA